MWKINMAAGLAVLLILSWIDIRKKQIPCMLLAVLSVLAAGYRICCGAQGLWLSAAGLLVGGVFAGISFCTREALGYGDSWVMGILGIYLGLWRLLALLELAFLLAGLFSAAWLIGHRGKGGKTFPFIPMLTAAYMGVMFF